MYIHIHTIHINTIFGGKPRQSKKIFKWKNTFFQETIYHTFLISTEDDQGHTYHEKL